MKYLIALGPDKYDSENYLCRDGGASFCIWHLGKYSKFNTFVYKNKSAAQRTVAKFKKRSKCYKDIFVKEVDIQD